MVLVYATTADLAADPWLLTDPPTNVARLIAKASQMVRTATRTALYDTDAAGKPSDTDVLAGFRDAVCAQVTTWVSSDIDPTKVASSSGVVSSKGYGPRSVAYAGADQAAAARAQAASGLTDEAMGYLTDLGLFRSVRVYG
jgi:hypothetical protein